MMPKSTAPIDSKLADSSAQIQHAEGKQQRQRQIDGDDDRAADIAQEHQQDHRHQHDADQQVFLDRLGRRVDQVGAVVKRLDLDARRQAARACCSTRRSWLARSFSAGSDSAPLRSSTSPCTTSSSSTQIALALRVEDDVAVLVLFGPAEGHLAQARLIADDDALRSRSSSPGLSGPPSTTSPTRIGRLLVVARTIWRICRSRRCSSARRYSAASSGAVHCSAMRCIGSRPRPIRPRPRTTAADLALHQVIAADVGVAVGDGVLQLLERDAVALQAVGIGLDLVALHRAAEADHVGDAGNAAELAFQRPVCSDRRSFSE